MTEGWIAGFALVGLVLVVAGIYEVVEKIKDRED